MADFLYQKVGADAVSHADSGDIKVFVQFAGNSILKISLRFWNSVGCGHMRGCVFLKITQCVCLITLVIFICEIGGTYLISHQPTLFQPPQFSILGRFFIQNFFPQSAAPLRLVSKCSKFKRESFENTFKTSRDFPYTVLPTQKLKSRFSSQLF